MRINVLQHTPNEGPGSIQAWSHKNGHTMFVYHPYQFHVMPSVDETDMLVILGGPMSVNDNLPWLNEERDLIKQLIERNVPIFGACLGAQQIAKALGSKVFQGSVKEVGWAPVYRQSEIIPGIPDKLMALHWHQEVFDIPKEAQLLFSSDHVKNQGFVINHRIVGLQFHFEPEADNVAEMVVNDGSYAKGSILKQTPQQILDHPVPDENHKVMFKILDYISQNA